MYEPSEKEYSQIISENLTRLMRERGWSTRVLGEKIGTSQTAVNTWRQGKFIPREDKIEKLCQVFNITRSELTSDYNDIKNLSVPAAHPLPILGEICAGNGILGEENFTGLFFVDRTIKADYCLEVEGDSMIDAQIYHGDIAFLKKSYDFLDGRIYAVRYGEFNNAVLKKVYRQENGLLLVPCNDAYKPIVTNDFLIVGELVGVYHPR